MARYSYHRHVFANEAFFPAVERRARGESPKFAYCATCGCVPTEIVGVTTQRVAHGPVTIGREHSVEVQR